MRAWATAPLPSLSITAADHGDGDHQIAPRAQLHEGGRPVDRQRHDDGGEDLVGFALGLAIAGDEFCERQAPCASAGQQLHFGIEGQQRRHAVGGRRGVAEIAGDGGAVLDLDRADLARRRLQRIEAGGERRGDQLAPGGAGADPHMIGCCRDAGNFADARDVQHRHGDRAPHMGRIEIRATRQDLDVGRLQGLDRLVQGARPNIHRCHAASSSPSQCPLVPGRLFVCK